ncbi:unnamed protein product [Cuscuta epithymum]|uniref:K Homology domain-containing protein n=1 Tax=Cuscuta epithymum TaxID=186058 RepID=A0AAV0EGE6_9ASTE|nr:unnamed protein product [Cuscuta epithymum]
MLAARFFRTDTVSILSKTCLISKRLPLLQGCSYSTGFTFNSDMDLKEALLAVKEQKKKRVVTQAWRPVSTLSSISEGIISKGGESESARSNLCSNTSKTCTGGSNTVGETTPYVDDQQISPAEKHSLSIEAGASLMRFIKGKGGVTQKKIEQDMGVQIIFPLSQKEDSITIESNSAESVAGASERIKTIIDEAVNSPNLDYSHFVSLPLAIHVDLVNKLNNFQSSILGATEVNEEGNLESNSNEDTSGEEDEGLAIGKAPKVVVEPKTKNDGENVNVDVPKIALVSYAPKASKSSTTEVNRSKLPGIQKSTFINPKTFHLTVLMLKLWNKARVEKAAQVLQECMKGSFASARVLYAPVEEIGSEGRLSRACQVIIDAFIEAGLVLEKDTQQKLKLHATVMNARHTTGRKKWPRHIRPFDARTIYEQYGSEEWGEYLISEAHLSQRFAYDENGYYHCCASIPFPGDS